jgi:thymidylate synthase (FAD)
VVDVVRVLDHGYVGLVEAWGSDERIVEAARMSTAKGFVSWGPLVTGVPCHPNGEPDGRPREVLPDFLAEAWRSGGRPSSRRGTTPYRDVREEPGDERLLRYLWDHHHDSPFEFAGLVVEVQAPIMVLREWQRHRTQSYSERSARYAPLPDADYAPAAERLEAARVAGRNRQAQGDAPLAPSDELAAWLAELGEVYAHAGRVYRRGLELGVPRELARLPVPVGRYSAMRAAANLRNWLAFLKLRCAPDAQWEFVQYARAVAGIVRDRFPRTYAVARESCGLP